MSDGDQPEKGKKEVFSVTEVTEVKHRTFKEEMLLFLNISGPALLSNVIGQAQWLISSSFAGKELGAEALAAISLTLLAAMVVRSVMVGIHSGFETLAGNSYGETNFKEVGLLMQSTVFLCSSLVVPMGLFYFNIKGLLDMLGQPAKVVELTSDYLKIYTFIFPAETGYEIVRKFYQCQNVTMPFLYIKVIATVFHYFAVNRLIKDVMHSFFLTEWLTFLLATQVYCLRLHRSDTWQRWSVKEATRGTRLKRILALGLPGILSLSEWWYYEFQTVLVGSLGTTALAAHSIAYFIVPLFFHIPYGFATAAQTRIAVVMGERNTALAKRLSLGTLGLNSLVGVCSAIIVYSFQNQVFSFFTSTDREEYHLIKSIWPCVAVYTVFDATLASALGIMRGLGKHSLLAKIVTVILWIVGVPMLLFFIYILEWKLWGLWFGNDIIYTIMGAVFVYTLKQDSVYKMQEYTTVSQVEL